MDHLNSSSQMSDFNLDNSDDEGFLFYYYYYFIIIIGSIFKNIK